MENTLEPDYVNDGKIDYSESPHYRADKGKTRARYRMNIDIRYRNMLNRCNALGRYMELTEEEFVAIVNAPCHYCGSDNKISLSMIEHNGTYSLDNVRPCCGECNMLKSASNERFFLRTMKKIMRYMDSLS